MKRLGLLILLIALVIAGVLMLDPGGGANLGPFEEPTDHDVAGVFEESVGLSGIENETDTTEATVNAMLANVAEGERSSLDMGAHGEIYGRVLDQLSEPIAGAKVFLHGRRASQVLSTQAPILARAQTDKEGRFELRGLSFGAFRLRASALGWAEYQIDVQLTAGKPKKLGLTLKLRDGHALGGVVVDPEGKSVADAWVVARHKQMWSGNSLWHEMKTDGEGRFEFGSVPTGKFQVLAWAEGHALGAAMTNTNDGSRVRVELGKKGKHKIAFHLMQSKKPSEGPPGDVSVMLQYKAEGMVVPLPSPIRNLDVPKEGKVESRGLREGSYSLFVDSDEVSVDRPWLQQKLTAEKPALDLELKWKPALVIEGRLIFKNKKPAAGITLTTWANSRVQSFSATSDKDGYFSFPKKFKPKIQSWIILAQPGVAFEGGNGGATWARVTPGKKDQVFTLQTRALITGKVVGVRGKPVPGAQVWLHLVGRSSNRYGQAVADDKGSFVLSISRKSSKPLRVSAGNGNSVCPVPVPVEGMGKIAQSGLVVRIVEGGWIEGEVVDEKGAGIEGVRVSATFVPKPGAKKNARGGRGRMRQKQGRSAFTNREGLFRMLGVAEGSWRVTARLAGRMKKSPDPTVELALGQKLGGMRFVLSEGLTIEGRMVSDIGKPIAKMWVSARFDGKVPKGETGTRASTQTDAEGRFTLSALRPGQFWLTAQLSWQVQRELGLNKPGPDGRRPMRPQTRQRVKVMAGIKDYRWQMAIPRRGEIHARIAHSGAVLTRIQVVFKKDKKRWSFKVPVVKGAIRMKGVLVGSYDLTFTSTRFADLKVQTQVFADQVADIGMLSLEDLPMLDVRVTDKAGHAISGVWIGVESGLTNLWPRYDIQKGPEQFGALVLAQSDAAGWFRVPVKGRVRVYGFKPGFAPGTLRYSLPKPKKGAAKSQQTKPAPGKKKPILVLSRAGEVLIQAPAAVKGRSTNWYGRLTRVATPGAPKGKGRSRSYSRSRNLKPGKPVRFIGLLPGRYRFQALDFRKSSTWVKKSVMGQSYYEEFQVQPGTNRLIRIP